MNKFQYNFQIPLHIYNDVLVDLNEALEKYNFIVLVGSEGSGKTTLIQQYLRNNKSYHNRNVTYFYGYELEFDKTKLEFLRNALTANKETLIIIDEFDSIRSSLILKQVILWLKEGRKYKAKIIIITRSITVGHEIDNAYILYLRKINESDLDKLVTMCFSEPNTAKFYFEALKPFLAKFGNSPLTMRMVIDLLQNWDYSPEQLMSIIGRHINYKNTIIENAFNINPLAYSKSPKIISDIININQSILNRVGRDPNSIYKLSSRQFEELIAELFEKKDYNVTLTRQTHDGGKDLLIIENKILGNFLCYVECKKYSPENPVGVKIVKELFGTITADRATAGVIITSSYFTKSAYTFTEKIKHQMNLIDFVELSRIIDTLNK